MKTRHAALFHARALHWRACVSVLLSRGISSTRARAAVPRPRFPHRSLRAWLFLSVYQRAPSRSLCSSRCRGVTSCRRVASRSWPSYPSCVTQTCGYGCGALSCPRLSPVSSPSHAPHPFTSGRDSATDAFVCGGLSHIFCATSCGFDGSWHAAGPAVCLRPLRLRAGLSTGHRLVCAGPLRQSHGHALRGVLDRRCLCDPEPHR
jgi:hypothetical protein